MSELRNTALYEIHRQLGASFTSFAGWNMPVRYSSDIEEHHAVREAAGLFDLSHMGQIELEGPGAAGALDAALVGWISKLVVGKAKYTMICDDAGGVIDDLVVYRTGEEQFLVVANASNHSTVLTQLLSRAAEFDTSVTNRSETDALVAIQGPASLEILRQVTDAPIDTLKYYSILRSVISFAPVKIARTGYTGEDGFEIYLNSREAVGVWKALTKAGESKGLKPAGLSCRDTLRLEAGMPLYGHELDIRTTPFDAGMGRIVALDKPSDFVGRKSLEERSHRPVERALVGLELDGRRIAREGQTVLIKGTDEPIGIVTSGAPSPTLRYPIAMAYIDAHFNEAGTEVAIDESDRRPCDRSGRRGDRAERSCAALLRGRRNAPS
ncbi:glycine cleavage system aminomethyltransferase GcvT [Aeromicrobium sp. 9AM]|uniref:glycine cleavage system aminomethyltransferase GcvT n=1 Tax=Aeromicrobium sp. 9AM TaxID=2653126 RepID=UPI0012F3B27A|nr:glycine cleavage system aminomethyltransferase GcvT [Aeromicrobium sp. 9AM]VXB06650.1 Aminomethyltransferase [Aeromicrobium sp. 9AM]